MYKFYRCQRFTTSQLIRPLLGSKERAKGIPEGSLVWGTGLSGAPPDSVRCTKGPRAKLLSLGNFQSRRAIIHRTCPVYTGQCPVLQEDAALELGSLGNSQRLLRYNSPDMSSVHQTVWCNRGATATSRQRSPAGALNAHAARAEVRRAHTGAPDTQQYMSGAPPDIQAGPEVRSSNSRIPTDWTWLAHRTVRCIIRQSASTKRLVWWLRL